MQYTIKRPERARVVDRKSVKNRKLWQMHSILIRFLGTVMVMPANARGFFCSPAYTDMLSKSTPPHKTGEC